jgi:integrative and conjugative element protein (TIGR02256 family)
MNPQGHTISVSKRARDEIATRTEQCLPNETGGILLGYREDDRFVVTDALAVVTVAPARTTYIRDDIAANVLLQRELANRPAEDPVGYIGEWHSHPRPCGPSAVDIGALKSIVKRARTRVILVIYAPHSGFQCLVGERGKMCRVRLGVAELID